MSQRHVPVLIVGAGPSGLASALFLAQHGIPYLLLERHPGTAIHARPIGLSPRTMELFRELGLEDAIRATAAPLARSRGEVSVRTLTRANLEQARRTTPDGEDLAVEARLKELIAEISPSAVCLCNQADLERILATSARARGEGELRFHTELLSFEQDATGVTATVIERGSGERRETLRADYLLNASREKLRKSIGLLSPGSR